MKDIDEVIKQYGAMVYRLGYLYTNDKHLAEDISQEVFLSAYKNLNTIREMKAWLIRSTINRARNVLRTQIRHPETELTENFADTGSDLYEETDVLEAIALLPFLYREAIILTYYQGFTAEEIARELNTTLCLLKKCLPRL
ncbi:MAG: RNA polymerase sigma factor [Caulobacteraceae bacterium]